MLSWIYICEYLCTDVHFVIFNPRCTCAARVTVLGRRVCLSVCVSVTTFSATVHYNAHNKTTIRFSGDLNLAISLQILRSGIMSIFAYSTKLFSSTFEHAHTDTWPCIAACNPTSIQFVTFNH